MKPHTPNLYPELTNDYSESLQRIEQSIQNPCSINVKVLLGYLRNIIEFYDKIIKIKAIDKGRINNQIVRAFQLVAHFKNDDSYDLEEKASNQLNDLEKIFFEKNF